MHILFINPQGNFDPEDRYWTEHPDFGGQLVYVKEVAAALGRLGHRVDILTRRIRDPEWKGFEKTLDAYPDIPEVRIVRLPCGGDQFLRKEDLWPFLGSEWVPNIIEFYRQEATRPDASTTHYADGGLCGALLKQELGIPFTFTAHSLGAQKMDKLGVSPGNFDELEAHFHFTQRIFAERVSMDWADRIITSTNQERFEQYSHRVYKGAVDPDDDAHFAVIPPGVNLSVFSTEESILDDEIRARIMAALNRDIHPERRVLPIVLASSRLDEKKNHLGLVKAFAEDERLKNSANLAIVVRGLEDPLRDYHSLKQGEREIFAQIISLMTSAGLQGIITAFPLNSQSELAAAYRILAERRSVFALTALYEPFGLAPLEAMSCGLPVVVTRNGGPSESLLEAGEKFGVLVDPADPADIARGLMKLIGSGEEWQALQEAGLKRVLERYTWERTAEGYLQVIGDLNRTSKRTPESPIPEYFTDPGQSLKVDALRKLYLER